MSDHRRVLMIAPTSFFLDYGCHVRILEEARALQAQGLRVRIVTYYKGNDWPGLDIVRCRPTPWRSDYEVGSSRHKIAFDALLFWKALQEARRWHPDVIHGHLHEGALIGSVVGRLTRTPVLFDFQGSLTGEMVDHNFITPDSFWYYWWRRLEERIVQMPDAIITSTTHSAEILDRGFGRRECVYPVPDSVNLDFFTPERLSTEERARRRAMLGIPPERTLVVYLGLLADYQGIPQLIEAAAYLRARDHPVSFLIMGFPGEDVYRRQAARLGLTPPDVIFTGRTRYAHAPDHLALGDVAVAPKISATEGSGKILNYMAMGLPVVAYKTDVSREYLGTLGVYAEPPGDARGLAQALAFVLRNPEAARLMGQHLRERAHRHFSWARTGRQLLKIYTTLWKDG
ncbi:MAG: glycosyltransferase family 4 protein [Anaerolineae bacterium]